MLSSVHIARRLLISSSLCMPALLLGGCGWSDYEPKFDAAIARLKIENKFKTLDDAPSVAAAWKSENAPTGTKVTFRKPKYFTRKPFNASSTSPNKPDEPLRVERLKPPFLPNFPGFYQSWEELSLSQRGSSTAYLYVGGQPIEPGLADRILQDIKTAFPALETLAWGNTDVDTPDGGRAKWRSLTFTAQQDFWARGDATPEVLNDSIFLILLKEEAGRQIIIAGRWSPRAGEPGEMLRDILAAAGTVTVATGVKID